MMLVPDRQIRVFISSTFRDMQAERDYLVKFTFPQLRKLCESRGVTWGEVDLRWGITDEEKAEGKVLPLCLEEIHRCRPYFIGLLGERYGWIPDAIPQEVIERESWLREHVNERKSVTELEILHGVFNNPEMANHAFFYFRDPKYVTRVAQSQRNDFTSENQESAERLNTLKNRIRHSAFPLREDYADPEALGELVFQDFVDLINRLYPAGEEPDPLTREAQEHEAHAETLARVYIGREEYFDQLDKHAQGDGAPLVVLGESGSGKSALLANWFRRHRQQDSKVLHIIHFIGSTADSADYLRLLRRIMSELKLHFPAQLTDDLPGEQDQVRLQFATWLTRAASVGQVVLVLDGLNQLEDRDAAPELGWLPVTFPANCRVIVSTLPGRALDAIKRRSWPQLMVEPLTIVERSELIEQFLAQSGRRLSADRVAHIARSKQTANPLFLRAVLDELRQFGEHERLGEQIGRYLAAPEPAALYGLILQRWEQDYGERVVSDSLSLIWASRRGLSEAELLDLLGSGAPGWFAPLPRAVWTPFFLAAESTFSRRSGLLNFSHSYVRDAVASKYLKANFEIASAHSQIAEYFAFGALFLGPKNYDQGPVYTPLYGGDQIQDWVDQLAPRPYNRRKVIEEPWQRAAAWDWRKLEATLTDLIYFQAIWELDQPAAANYWRVLKTAGKARIAEAYAGVVRNADRFSLRILWAIGRFLSENGHPDQALPIQRCIVDRTAGNRLAQILAVTNLSQTLSRLADGNNAMEILMQARAEMTESGVASALAPVVCELGRLLYEKGEFSEALDYLREASALCRTGMEWGPDLLGKTLLYRSLAHVGLGEVDIAIRLAHQSVDEFRRGQKPSALAWSLNVRGSLLQSVDETAAARDDLKEALAIYELLQDSDAADNVRAAIAKNE